MKKDIILTSVLILVMLFMLLFISDPMGTIHGVNSYKETNRKIKTNQDLINENKKKIEEQVAAEEAITPHPRSEIAIKTALDGVTTFDSNTILVSKLVETADLKNCFEVSATYSDLSLAFEELKNSNLDIVSLTVNESISKMNLIIDSVGGGDSGL